MNLENFLQCQDLCHFTYYASVSLRVKWRGWSWCPGVPTLGVIPKLVNLTCMSSYRLSLGPRKCCMLYLEKPIPEQNLRVQPGGGAVFSSRSGDASTHLLPHAGPCWLPVCCAHAWAFLTISFPHCGQVQIGKGPELGPGSSLPLWPSLWCVAQEPVEGKQLPLVAGARPPQEKTQGFCTRGREWSTGITPSSRGRGEKGRASSERHMGSTPAGSCVTHTHLFPERKLCPDCLATCVVFSGDAGPRAAITLDVRPEPSLLFPTAIYWVPVEPGWAPGGPRAGLWKGSGSSANILTGPETEHISTEGRTELTSTEQHPNPCEPWGEEEDAILPLDPSPPPCAPFPAPFTLTDGLIHGSLEASGLYLQPRPPTWHTCLRLCLLPFSSRFDSQAPPGASCRRPCF